MARRSGQSRDKKPDTPVRRRVTLEPLEPRILLSADPTLLGALDPHANDHLQVPEETSVLADRLDDREVVRFSEAAFDADWIVDEDDTRAVADEWVTPAEWDARDDSLDSEVTAVDTGIRIDDAATPASHAERLEAVESDTEVSEAEVVTAPVTFDNSTTTSFNQVDEPTATQVTDDSLARGPPSDDLGLSTPTVQNLLLNGTPLPSGDFFVLTETALRATEIAFAKTMANRDLKAFSSFLSPEVVFFNGDTVLRGPEAVAQVWARFFEAADAPFSWEPEAVAVLGSGTLGYSSGPVFDPQGTRIGTFNSVWRLTSNGNWKIIFDRGCP